jgi:predicted membrane GTPase involved in stress response
VKPNQSVKVLDHDGKLIETGRITKVLAFRGSSAAVDEAEAGDIVAIAGLPKATVATPSAIPTSRRRSRRSRSIRRRCRCRSSSTTRRSPAPKATR